MDSEECSNIVQSMVAHGKLGLNQQSSNIDDDASMRAAVVYNTDILRRRFTEVKTAFPSWWRHTLAVKSAPIRFVLEAALEHGLGLECASYDECLLAMQAGCAPSKIVFNSPCKTKLEMTWAIKTGVNLNLDNFEELECVNEILEDPTISTWPVIGMRINPLMGVTGTAEMSVSTSRSKFGIDITHRKTIIQKYRQHNWLSGLHVHVGSMSDSYEFMVRGIQKMTTLANEINEELKDRRVRVLDIGGGITPSGGDDFKEYSECLSKIPELYHLYRTHVVTEFGRAYLTWSAFAVSVVQAVKPCPSDARIECNIVCHLGADIFTRACYAPHMGVPQITLLDCTGKRIEPSSRTSVRCDIAGPLCFEGDKVVRGIELPQPINGDLIVFHGVGANSVALWSHHCSRPVPPLWKAYNANGTWHTELQESLHRFVGRSDVCRVPWSIKTTTHKRALLIIDLQPEWYSKSVVKVNFPGLGTKISRLLRWCREHEGTEIVHIQSDYSHASQLHARFKDYIGETRVDTPSKISEPFAMAIDGETIIHKRSYNAFEHTNLHAHLQRRGINDVSLAGVLTSVCIEKTAYGGFTYGYNMSILKDCCGDVSRAAHERGITQMQTSFARISGMTEFVGSNVNSKTAKSKTFPSQTWKVSKLLTKVKNTKIRE